MKRAFRLPLPPLLLAIGCAAFLKATLALGQASPLEFSKESYYPKKYRHEIDTASDARLKRFLYKILTKKHLQRNGEDTLVNDCRGRNNCYGQKELSYTDARKALLGKLHLLEDEKGHYIRDVYCQKRFTWRNARVGPDRIPRTSKINCEHTWPRSRFNRRFSRILQKSDLHHLYPTDAISNSTRRNHRFAEGGTPLKNCSPSRQKRHSFEPPDEHKGNVARALFYFAIRYKIAISTNEEEYLRAWHLFDPADKDERERNQKIHEIQGNRNPFIDFPELVSRIGDF